MYANAKKKKMTNFKKKKGNHLNSKLKKKTKN